ncbi:MAG: hypothetical protein HKL96_07440 [Phycisphaerales bacterium]|nr:hypothetical protein [Phycisphaerales bacterium]
MTPIAADEGPSPIEPATPGAAPASRRAFIAGAATSAAALLANTKPASAAVGLLASDADKSIRTDYNLATGTGSPVAVPLDDAWRLWLDVKASWQQDQLYLPDDEVNLDSLPVNAPTGGWDALSPSAGIAIILPATVEEHYWGKAPLPRANPRNAQQVASLDSPYIGVSWWYRRLLPPELAPGERLVISFPGARLRAEVYVNGKLVGYNCIGEIPFTADITDALKPGDKNMLAVRITNPGGTFSWGDYPLQNWGKYRFPISHGFGGMDGGVSMAACGPIAVDDLYVANQPNPRTVTLHAEVRSSGPAYKGMVMFTIMREGKTLWRGGASVEVPAQGRATVTAHATVPDAELWDIGRSMLYRAEASVAGIVNSARATDFGFRWFSAEGIGTNARLMLNGRRVFVSSAISWGFWAPNGMFPDAAAVKRDVHAARSLGLNCVQTHRHFPKASSLVGFDHAGLLRYCEPCGGSAIWDETIQRTQPYPKGPIDTSGKGGEPVTFANRYELAKICAMIKAYRSHPCIIMWSLNNETGANLHNPKIFYALRKAHALDPSRILVLKSGFGPQGEVLALPYSSDLTYGDSATHHDSGWHDHHNENDQGVYQDSVYQGPDHFKCRSVNTTDILMWGEAGTGNSPDDYAADVQWYRRHRAGGYTKAAAEARLLAYEIFLDKYGFREAYPTAATLLRQVGARHYFEASHLLENVRIANANDYVALSGWESTTHDNNSGLVDSLRLLKADPALMRQANAPELLVLHARHYVVPQGQTAVVDAYIVNEVNRRGRFELHFQAAMKGAENNPFFSTSSPVTIAGGNMFGQPMQLGLTFTLPHAGPVTLTAFLTKPGSRRRLLQRTEPMLAVNANPGRLPQSLVCVDYDGTLAPAIKRQFGMTPTTLARQATPKTILVSSGGAPRYVWPRQPHVSVSHATGTDDPGLYHDQYLGKVGPVARFSGLAAGTIKVELFFAEPVYNKPGERVFDVALNGKIVWQQLDIAREAGAKGAALTKTTTINSRDGSVTLSVPKASNGEPIFAAIKLTDSHGHIIREVFRRQNYQSLDGQRWTPVRYVGFDWNTVLSETLPHVRQGARLVLLGMDARDIGEAAQCLDRENILKYLGSSGMEATPWIGHWYFSRRHWLLDGLPSGCVLDWQYQAAAGGDEFLIEAPGMQAVIGYGCNPGPGLGFGAAVVPVSHGEIVLLGVPGLNAAFIRQDAGGFDPVAAARIVYNAISGA